MLLSTFEGTGGGAGTGAGGESARVHADIATTRTSHLTD